MKITVIVPVYNVENYIERCVSSLREQTLSDIEIILVDDGSTDNSPQMIDEYAKEDDRIRIIHKANAGQGLARNDGMDIAQGEYVCFLDSDDYVEHDMCEKLYELMTQSGADMCSFGYQIDSPDGTVIRKPRIIKKTYDGEAIKKEFVLHFFGDDPADDNLRGYSSCMSCFRLSVIRDNSLHFLSEREVLSEDNLFCLEFCRYADRVVTTDDIFYHYVRKADSFSQGYSAGRMDMTKSLARNFRKYAQEYGVADKADMRISGLTWINMMATIKQDVRRVSASNTGNVTKAVVKNDIKQLCRDEDHRRELLRLKGSPLPLKQKVFLTAYLNKWVGILYLMADIRGRERI